MKSAATDYAGWSRRQWTWTIGGFFAAQVALIFLFSQYPHARGPEPARPRFRMETAPVTSRLLARTFFATDPTLFSSSSLHSFSGPAWLRLPKETNSMPQLGAPERWLELDPASLGQLAQTAAALSPLSLAADGLASPKITEMGVMRSEAPAAPAQSVARLTDGLESRLSEPPAPLQLWPAPADLLSPLVSNSVVEIAVDNGGAVVSARILRRSGVDQADAQALQLARTMRFTPRSQSRTSLPGMQWGRVIVDWQTGTNVAAAPVEAIP